MFLNWIEFALACFLKPILIVSWRSACARGGLSEPSSRFLVARWAFQIELICWFPFFLFACIVIEWKSFGNRECWASECSTAHKYDQYGEKTFFLMWRRNLISSQDFYCEMDLSVQIRFWRYTLHIFVEGLSPKYLSAPFLAFLFTCTGSYLFLWQWLGLLCLI